VSVRGGLVGDVVDEEHAGRGVGRLLGLQAARLRGRSSTESGTGAISRQAKQSLVIGWSAPPVTWRSARTRPRRTSW
jgi:hypothetical protein